MACENLGILLGSRPEPGFQHLGNSGMQVLALRFKQRLIGGVLD
jgi:hypothetical protein